MLLAIDAGNTNTTLGVYEAGELRAHWRLTTNPQRTVDEYGVHTRNLFQLADLNFKDIEAIAIASVVPPLNYTLRRMAETYFHLTPMFIDYSTTTGIEIHYQPPSDVGADRIVDAVAAVTCYGCPCIVVDFGTATTFNVINEKRQYLGGVITPGIMISTEALFSRTAKLPRVDIKRPRSVIGSSTVEAMQSGLYYGYAGLVDGVLGRLIEEMGVKPRVIATGGLAPLIATASTHIEHVDDTLTLTGIRLIYEMNRSNPE